MKKRYIVSIDGNITNQENENFNEFLKNKNVSSWHWLSNTWLIVDNSDSLSSEELCEKSIEIFNNRRNIIVDISSRKWSGYGPQTENEDMFKWFDDNWNKA